MAPNTIFKNPTKRATSSVKILGVTVGQPSGLNLFMFLPPRWTATRTPGGTQHGFGDRFRVAEVVLLSF
jgi:hypothetical protein